MAQDSSPTRGPRKVVRMGKYEVVAHIATGGMGAVYLARDTEDGRQVALKILTAEAAAKPAMLERFRREARHAGKLRHENIVTLFDFDEINGTYFIAMEYVDGLDLHEYTQHRGTVEPEEARFIILQGARALRHAFEQNIVHRDVKPSNFLVARRKGRPLVKLTDLGLARETSNDEYRVTRAGTTVGTLDYMAPEQARDSSAADIRSDLYALGCTWYHLLTGHAPFPDGGLAERLYKIMNAEPPDARELNPLVSDETWEVLSRLLAKEPEDRFQTPGDLVDALLALEGKATARLKPAGRVVARTPKGKRRKSSAADTRVNLPAPKTKARPRRPSRAALWLAVGGGAFALAAVGVLVAVLLFGRGRHAAAGDEDLGEVRPAPEVVPPPTTRPVVKPPTPEKRDPPDKGPVVTERLPVLEAAAQAVDGAALRKEIEAPWAGRGDSAASFVARVERLPREGEGFPTLAAACKAAPAGRPITLELWDNGPLFESGLAVEGRDVTVQAGPGYRPLLVWDVRRVLDERKREKGGDGRPLAFLSVRKGSLTLRGLEVACPWPDSSGEPAALLDLDDADLSAVGCTFSLAGRHPEGVVLARVRGTKAGRCRLADCRARGAALTALDVDGVAEDVLFDDCLVSGGEATLFRVRTDGKRRVSLSLVHSTLVGANKLVEVRCPAGTDRDPAVHVLTWDVLASRSSKSGGGAVLTLGDKVEPRDMTWRSVNTLYANWQDFLAGPDRVGGDDLSGWQRLWRRVDGDRATRDPWPDPAVGDPAGSPASAFAPTRGVLFASSGAPEVPLGSDLARLPAARDGWQGLAGDPTLTLPDSASDPGPPEAPGPDDGPYRGERLELTKGVNLGDHLRRVQMKRRLAPRVVMRLCGTGEVPTSAIRLKGTSLALFFEPPATRETPPLALRLEGGPADAQALIDLDGGSLEVAGGTLRVPELSRPAVAWVVKVSGGDVRLYRTWLEGPQQVAPMPDYRGLVSVAGSGDAADDKFWHCSASECVFVSGRAGVVLDGVGARLLLRESLVVAGGEAVRLTLAGCKDRPNVQCRLERVTAAAGKAVFGLGDPARDGVPSEPAVVQTQNCAFLYPFAPKPANPAGLLLAEGDALARGLLVCQGDHDSFDRRLTGAQAAWERLWGSGGVREARPALSGLKAFDARRWQLERLAVRDRGANFELLDLAAHKPRP